MPEQSWLMESLADASRRAEQLPRWAREINLAVDQFYHRAYLQNVQHRVDEHTQERKEESAA